MIVSARAVPGGTASSARVSSRARFMETSPSARGAGRLSQSRGRRQSRFANPREVGLSRAEMKVTARLLGPLLVLAALGGVAAFVLFRGAGPPDEPPRAEAPA